MPHVLGSSDDYEMVMCSWLFHISGNTFQQLDNWCLYLIIVVGCSLCVTVSVTDIL